MSSNSILIIPTSNVASPIITSATLAGSAMMYQAAPSSYFCLPQTSLHDTLPPPSSQFLLQPSSALYLSQISSPMSPPHRSSYLYLSSLLQSPSLQLCTQLPYLRCVPVVPFLSKVRVGLPSVIYSSTSCSLQCPLCLSNSSDDRPKGGFRHRLRRLFRRAASE